MPTSGAVRRRAIGATSSSVSAGRVASTARASSENPGAASAS